MRINEHLCAYILRQSLSLRFSKLAPSLCQQLAVPILWYVDNILIKNPHAQRQLEKFDKLWQETKCTWPPPGFTEAKQNSKSFGLVALPEASACHNVCDMIEVIAKTWPWNISYSLPQLHVTIAGLGTASSWKSNEEILDAILRHITVNQEPVEIDFQGLNILRNTIVVQALDKQNSFKNIVEKLSHSVHEAGLAKNLRIGVHNELWWTSIIGLYQPIPDYVLVFVESFKNVFFGSTILNFIHFN